MIGTTLRIRFQVLKSALIDQPKVSKYRPDTLDVASIKRTMKILSDKEKVVRKGGKRYGDWEVND